MIFRPFYYFDLGCAAYLFGCGSMGRCAVVDARADDIDTYLAFAAQKGMQITHVIDTHVHADHRSGGPELARRAGARYAAHESADLVVPFTPLTHGEEIALGNTRVKVIHTPGHSQSTIAFERRWNPMLSMPRDAFVEALANVPEKPADMARVLAFNRGVAEAKAGA